MNKPQGLSILIGVIFISLMIAPKTISAHPHVFIDAHIRVYFDNKGVSGFKITWFFDAMFSEIMIDQFDEDFDEKFNKEEQRIIYTKAFSNLKKFNYFTEINIDNVKFNIKYITNFTAKINNGVLSYSFFIPCHLSIGGSVKKVDVFVYDESYYMDVSLENESISLLNAEQYYITYKVVASETKKYYFDQIFPQVLHLNIKRR